MDEVVVIAGPTASGKTDLAVALARRLDAEIVSADSRQVYRDLDAATAKPERDARGRVDGVPYHLVDVVSPAEPFSAGRWARLARETIAEIRARGKRAIVCGGTGLYIRALRQGLAPLPQRDEALRERLRAQAEREGREALHARLARLDPEAARAIPANNINRVIRALEVCELSGKPMSALWTEGRADALEARWLTLALEWPPEELRARIARRAAAMWPALLAETRRLVPASYSGEEPGFQSLGYPEALACARGQLSSEAGLAAMIAATNAYAKRQRTWFRGQCPDAVRVPGGAPDKMLAAADRALCAGAR